MVSRKLLCLRWLAAAALLVWGVAGVPPLFASGLAAGRVSVASRVIAAAAQDDMGAMPASQMMPVTVRLKSSAERSAALDVLISGQMAPGGASYRRWITPAEFAAEFGATDDQIGAVSGWLESSGLTVAGVSAGKTRLTVTGSSAAVAAAFGVQLRMYRSGTGIYFANAGAASVPESMGELVAGVSGLDDRPAAAAMTVSGAAAGVEALAAIETMVDANTAPILSVTTAACSADFGDADLAAYSATLKQAEAQGITVLATSGCLDGGSFPASLPEVTAVVSPDAAAEVDFEGIATRPGWQFADGLPTDGWREAPDVAADVTMLAQTLTGIAQKAGTRLGNVAPVLYELAKESGLYTQPAAPAGTWERATGLGVVDLAKLAEDFPRGSIGTSSLLTVSNYAPTHGSNLTLTAKVTSTGGSGIPTGTVTFTCTQKGTLGTAVMNSAGVGTFTTDQLPAGTYTTTSVYSGDANYSGSTSGVATITIVAEVSIITATVEPGAAVGSNATIDVSVTSASKVGTPSGTVTVAPQGTKNPATASATLVGANETGTATVSLPVYEAGQFTLLISCTDPDPSFTCNSPLSIQMTVGKGATVTTLAISPSVPTVGASFTLTATVASAGVNEKGATIPTGNMQFMDGTTYLSTAAISGGVATYTGTYTAGAHSFEALYQGDNNYLTSNSNSTTTTGGVATSTSLTASASSINVGQTVTFSSTVSSAGVASTETGTVTYTAAKQGVLGTGTVSGGLATLTLSNLAAGVYNVTAMYSGDSVFAASTSAASVTVTVVAVPSIPTATVVTSSTTSVLAGVSVVLTATVTGTPAGVSVSASPTGSVNFFDSFGGVLSQIGSGTLVAGGANTSSATLSTNSLAAGPHTIYAVYVGDSIYLGSTSATLDIGSTNFSVTFVPTTLTVARGQTGQATLMVSFQGGFAGSVSLGCTPPPNIELTCSFSPAVLAAGGTTTLTVGTVGPSDVKASGHSDARPHGGLGQKLAGGAVLAMLLMWVRPRLLRGRIALMFMLLAVAALGVTGCGAGTNNATSGSGSGTGTGDPGTSLGTQILAITTAGSDGTNTVRHDFQYQVTVQ